MKKKKSNASFSIILAALCLSTSAVASYDFIPLQERAQGQSLSGSHLLNDSLFVNPAASAFVQAYSVDANYLSNRQFALSILDTKTSALGGAVGYFREPVGSGTDMRQGAKAALFSQVNSWLALGVSGKLAWGNVISGVDTRTFNSDVGLFSNFTWAQLGLTLQNVLGDRAAVGQEQEAVLGGRIGYDNSLFLSVAAHSRFSNLAPYQFGIGAEYLTRFYFSLKGGYRHVVADSQGYWSAGLSFLSPKITFNYAVEFPNERLTSHAHIIGTTLLF